MRLLVTGGAGFIGSNFVRRLLRVRPEISVLNLDLLTYAGNPENLADLPGDSRHRFVRGDVRDPAVVQSCLSRGVDAIVNFAAESHVDRAILDSTPFVTTNVLGTQVLLEAVRKAKNIRFVQVSTDEVYGSIEEGKFSEGSRLEPNSPYAASKAAADLLVRSYHRTYGTNAVVTRCGNNYGPRQFPEKLIPLMILNALADRPLPIYGDGLQVRDWIYVEDHCEAIEKVLFEGRAGETYNIGADGEKTNLEVVRELLAVLGKPESLMQRVDDRPGHDRRYAIDASKIRRELGWTPRVSFRDGLRDTVQWYLDHKEWVDHVQDNSYREYYDRMYLKRDQTLAGL